MNTRRLRAFALAGLIVAATAATAVAAPGGTSTGPNTTTKPYVLPVGDGVSIKSLLTVGDGAASNGYEMVGIPDGLGLVRSEEGDRDFTLFMNHELRGNQGVARRHGKTGAFVSELRDRLRHLRGRGGPRPDRPRRPLLELPHPGLRPHRRPRPASTRATRATPSSPSPPSSALLLEQHHRVEQLYNRVEREGLQGPDLLRQRGERRRGPGLRRHHRRPGAAAAAARPVLLGEHPRRLQRQRHDRS